MFASLKSLALLARSSLADCIDTYSLSRILDKPTYNEVMRKGLWILGVVFFALLIAISVGHIKRLTPEGVAKRLRKGMSSSEVEQSLNMDRGSLQLYDSNAGFGAYVYARNLPSRKKAIFALATEEIFLRFDPKTSRLLEARYELLDPDGVVDFGLELGTGRKIP